MPTFPDIDPVRAAVLREWDTVRAAVLAEPRAPQDALEAVRDLELDDDELTAKCEQLLPYTHQLGWCFL